MQTLIAEDLLLLLLDDAKGTLAASDKVQPLLGGALLLELALAGRVGVAERTSRWTSAKVAVTGTPPGEPLLDGFRAIVSDELAAVLSLFARIGLLASLQGILCAYGRNMYSLSRAGYYPQFLSLTGKRPTPWLPASSAFTNWESRGCGTRLVLFHTSGRLVQ